MARTYSITAKRMISELVLKYLNRECFVIRRGHETACPVSSSFCLTVPNGPSRWVQMVRLLPKGFDRADLHPA